jgi:hypothetical protein
MKTSIFKSASQHTRLLPPYVPFSAFLEFLRKVSRGLPSRIDNDVMPLTSRTIKLQLAATLRFLGLANPDGTPTEILRKLAKATTEERKALLRETITRAYPFVFGELDLKDATGAQLNERFREQGVSGDTLRKCVAFLARACREAGITVSRYIRPYRKDERPAPPRVNRESSLRLRKVDSPSRPSKDSTRDRAGALRSLLPPFDPDWSEEIKTKWFDTLQAIIKLEGVKKSRR